MGMYNIIFTPKKCIIAFFVRFKRSLFIMYNSENPVNVNSNFFVLLLNVDSVLLWIKSSIVINLL